MLRGTATEVWAFAVLAIIAIVTLTIGWFGLRRGMTRV